MINDETGPGNDNLIAGNQVHDNVFACGITMASHPLAPGLASKLPYGVYRNTFQGNVQGNVSTHNGMRAPGDGAGVGIFAAGPVANYISGNAADTADAATSGPAGINIFSNAAIMA